MQRPGYEFWVGGCHSPPTLLEQLKCPRSLNQPFSILAPLKLGADNSLLWGAVLGTVGYVRTRWPQPIRCQSHPPNCDTPQCLQMLPTPSGEQCPAGNRWAGAGKQDVAQHPVTHRAPQHRGSANVWAALRRRPRPACLAQGWPCLLSFCSLTGSSPIPLTKTSSLCGQGTERTTRSQSFEGGRRASGTWGFPKLRLRSSQPPRGRIAGKQGSRGGTGRC